MTPIIQRADPKWANSYLDDGAYERVLEREKKRDKDLNIQRDTIPTQVIVFPNTPHSLQCQEIVEQIDRQTATACGVESIALPGHLLDASQQPMM